MNGFGGVGNKCEHIMLNKKDKDVIISTYTKHDNGFKFLL